MKTILAPALTVFCAMIFTLEAADVLSGKPHVYKTSGGKERVMEIYFPPGHDPAKSKVPGMILFHGGGWSSGSLDQFRFACQCFASRGLICATANYRMLGKDDAKLPNGESKKRVCVTDGKSAIRWFKQHADEFGVDPDRIAADEFLVKHGLITGKPTLKMPASGEKLIAGGS